jgi:hypothetical protein
MTVAEQLRTIKHALSVAEIEQLLQLDEETIRRHVSKGSTSRQFVLCSIGPDFTPHLWQ